jgi:hypothetical protein
MTSAARPASLLATVLASIACATTLAPPAAADWETPVTTLSPYRLGTWNPTVSLDRDGNALALWTSSDEAETPDRQNVYATAHPLGAAWAPLTEVWPGAYASFPTMAGNASGNAVAAWVGDENDYANVVHVAERTGASGAWGGHRAFGSGDVNQEWPAVALNDRGDAVATWVEWEGDALPILRATTRTASGWTEPVTVSAPDAFARGDYSVSPQLEIAPDGTADVLWSAIRDPGENGIEYVQHSHFDGTSWSAPQDLAASPTGIGALDLADDGNGELVAAWMLWQDPRVIQVGWRSGGAWTIADSPADPLLACSTPLAVSAGPGGRATVAWQSTATRALSTVSGLPGAWEQPRKVYTPTETSGVDTVELRERFGKAPVAAWTTTDYDDWSFTASASQLTDSGWKAPTLLASAGTRDISAVTLDMDPTGRAIAGWTVYSGYVGKVQVAWASGVRPPAPPVDPGKGGLGVLNPPFVRVRGGLLRLPRRGRTVTARLVNRERVVLRGTARLVHFSGRRAKGGSPMRTIAVQRKVRVAVKNPSKLRLKLNAEAIERLRKSPRHAYPARLYLRLRAPDGRTVKTTQTFTLDGWSRFGKGKRKPLARKAC